MYENIKGYYRNSFKEGIIIGGKDFDYKVFCSDKLKESLDDGEDYRLPVYLKHDEKGMELYGFIDESEREMFLALIKVAGIGCKGALKVLSAMTPYEIRIYKQANNIRQFCLVPGVSEKTAYKIIQTLKV